MGLFGGGNTKKTTTNQDNRIINDYSGADFTADNSIDNSIYQELYSEVDNSNYQELYSEVDNSNNGQFAGVNGNVSVTDGGAINAMAGALDTGFELANSLTRASLDSNVAVANNALALADNANGRTLSAALSVMDSSAFFVDSGNSLARDLVGQTSEALLYGQQENNSALNNGFKSMMQFAESFSRSDGASIAENSNKMVMVLAIAAAITVFAFKKIG